MARSAPFVLALAVIACLAVVFVPSVAADAAGDARYIVVLKDSVEHPGAVAGDQTEEVGGSVSFVYRTVLKGYAGTLPSDEVGSLEEDPRVKYVTPDRKVEVAGQRVPTGVDRTFATANPSLAIDAAENLAIDADVAVIDTGIDFEHPDLEVVERTDCVPSGEDPEAEGGVEECEDDSGTDGNSHGTHVAGTVGALDDGQGVVGVAPGARLWAVRVLNNAGSGSESWLIAGVEWVTAHSDEIEVANMSIGCSSLPCELPALGEAIESSAEAGVVYAVAAGNNGEDAKDSTFGTNPDVITVSALKDSDGQAGGKEEWICPGSAPDDTLASFSNYGEDVEVAAPGVCIYSTFPDGEYGYLSGTSMASPHVAGAAAILASRENPEDIEDVEAIAETIEEEGNFDWNDASGDGVKEPLLDLGSYTAFTANGQSAITRPPTIGSATKATLRGAVDTAGSEIKYRFEYGKTSSYGTSVPVPDQALGTGSGYAEVSQTVEGLQGQTPYHYRIVGTSSKGVSYGADRLFGTTVPAATTKAASAIDANDASLNATVNPNGLSTDYYFEFGPTAAYGRKAPVEAEARVEPQGVGAGTTSLELSESVGALTGGRTYHFRVVASNVAGTTYGEDKSFVTEPSQWVAQPMPGSEEQTSYPDVSCASRQECMVLGEVVWDPPFAEYWEGEEWSTVPMPTVEGASSTVPQRISCSSGEWCVAVGVFKLDGQRTALAQHWDEGEWSVKPLPLPPGATAPSELADVSCVSAISCTAVGYYTTAELGFPHLLVEHWDGNQWTAESVDPPKTRFGALLSVSCTSASYCLAVGYYSPQNEWHPLALLWEGDEWSVVQDIEPNGLTFPSLRAVSCAARDACTAIRHSDSDGEVAERWDGEDWNLEELPEAVDAESMKIEGISCPALDACAAVGVSYLSGYARSVPLALGWDGDVWSVQSTAEPTQEEEGSRFFGSLLRGVSCTTPTQCVAAGHRTTQDNEFVGMAEALQLPGPTGTTAAATAVSPSGATLNAVVNPRGAATSYRFEYGPTSAYGALVPTSPKAIGGGEDEVEVSSPVNGLEPETTYHFRVVATSSEGTAYGEDLKITTRAPTPVYSRSFGESGSGAGQLNEPFGVDVDSQGNVWVADSENDRLEKFDADGDLLASFGSSGSGGGQLNSPLDLAVDSKDNVWVADTGNDRIQKFNGKGEYLLQVGAKGSGVKQFDGAYGLTVDGEDDVWVAEVFNDRVQELDSQGNYLQHFHTVGFGADVAVDGDGDVWVADLANNHLHKFDSEGVELAQFGSVGSGDGQLREPASVTVDADGNVWVADSGNDRIQKFNSQGEYLTQFGEDGEGEGQLSFPRGIAFDLEGDAWVLDSYNSRVQKWSFGPSALTAAATEVKSHSAMLNAVVNPNGFQTTYQFQYGTSTAYGDSAPAVPASLGSGRIDVDASATIGGLKPETLYHFRVVAEDANGTVTYGRDETFTTHSPPPSFSFSFGSQGSGNEQFQHPSSVAVDAAGNLWVVDTYGQRLIKFNAKGEYLSKFGSSGSGSGQFAYPERLAIDAAGNIWVADTLNGRIQKFNAKGEYLSQVGTWGTGSGQLTSPGGVTIDAAGNVWVADTGNHRIQKFNAKGEYLAKFGSYGSGNGQFSSPAALAIDAAGDLWVADKGNQRIQELSPAGSFLSLVGGEGSGGGQFGSGGPAGIAINGVNGTMLVADTGNDRIQKFNGKGEYLGRFGLSGTGAGRFDSPTDVALDSEGGIWVADKANFRIQKWSYADPPAATTEAAAEIKGTSAALSATVNPEGSGTTYRFEYGTSTAYGKDQPVAAKDIGAGTSDVKLSETVGGLAQNTIYHFRVAATNAAGTTYGADRTLTTLKLPTVTTDAASGVKSSAASLNATVNPQGSGTSYQFEYGTTTSYGTKVPVTVKSVGSGTSDVKVAEAISGLTESTTYHYRLVASGVAGTVSGADKTFKTEASPTVAQLAGMIVTDPFDGSTSAVSNFSSDWSSLGWASGGSPKGENSSTGWRPLAAYPTVNGAFYGPALTDTGPGLAATATMAANPGNASRYFSLWLDMSSPAGTKAGYELRFAYVSTNTYGVTLSKWQGGTQTVLASQSSFSFANGGSLALVDQGGTVSAWTNAGAGFSQLLSAADATFSSGSAGVEGSGNITRLTNFRAGSLLTPLAGMDLALKSLAVVDPFSTNESPLSGGGAWAALSWANGTSGHNTGWVAGGWGPNDAYPTINGAYWQPATVADTGAGEAVVATLWLNPGNTSRYVSVWLGMPSPGSARTGYELRFTETSSGVYEVALSKWQAGAKTVLASKSGYYFPTKSQIALVDKGGTVSAWTKMGSEYAQVLSASDAAFKNGYAGVEGAGNITRLTDFRAAPLPPN